MTAYEAKRSSLFNIEEIKKERSHIINRYIKDAVAKGLFSCEVSFSLLPNNFESIMETFRKDGYKVTFSVNGPNMDLTISWFHATSPDPKPAPTEKSFTP